MYFLVRYQTNDGFRFIFVTSLIDETDSFCITLFSSQENVSAWENSSGKCRVLHTY